MEKRIILIVFGFLLLAVGEVSAQQQQRQQPQYVPPPEIGPPSPQTPSKPEQEIVYLGHEQARLGITLADDDKGHVWIRTIIAGSPADRAHLRPGDRLVAMNETPIHSYADAVRFINAHHPDQEITVAIDRDGTRGGVTAVLGWARGVQANTLSVPSASVQFNFRQGGQTYEPEYVYPNRPNEYRRPWSYGHLGTQSTAPQEPRNMAPEPGTTEGIGGGARGPGRGPG